MKKKLMAVLSAFIFTSSISFAAPSTVKVIVNGNELMTDTPAVIRNSRTMVPFRALFDALGAQNISWDEPTQTVSGSDGNTNIKLVIGSYDIDVNGKIITIDTPPMIINSRTMIPLSAVSTAMGSTVSWNAKDYVATVTKNTTTQISNADVNNSVAPIFTDITTPIAPTPITPATTPTKTVSNTDNKQIVGYYAMEDLKRNKYVLNLKSDGSAEIINTVSKSKSNGTYSYTNDKLNLNISSFNGTYEKENISYAGTNLLLMKDSKAPTAGSTFVLMQTTQSEYNKYNQK